MTAIRELNKVEIEHGFGSVEHKGFVILRCIGHGAVLMSQIRPQAAREIGLNLITSAARAEYEEDLFRGLNDKEVPEQIIATVMWAVRDGERVRLSTETPPTEF